jgi:hypothetical protein
MIEEHWIVGSGIPPKFIAKFLKLVLQRLMQFSSQTERAEFFQMLSRICGEILVPGVVPGCDIGRFP